MTARTLLSLAITGTLMIAGPACNSDSDDNNAPPPQQPGVGAPASPTIAVAPASANTCEHITDQQGKSLYMFATDNSSQSSCNDACAAEWPPIVSPNSNPAAVSGAARADLSGAPIKRADGSFQSMYGGHPLYTFRGDAALGETKGHCVNSFGGMWYLVKPDGTACGCESPGSIGGGGAPSDCGTHQVCGWTPGWRCWNNHNYRSQCCWNANDHTCNGNGTSDCGTYSVCGWTPGWRCWNNHNYRPSCCWNANDSTCTGSSSPAANSGSSVNLDEILR